MRRLDAVEPTTSIELDGQPISAREGENTACALLAAGETIFSRSIKYHRPRGPFCLTGACAHCLMRVDGVPNIPVCQTVVHPGMRLERQNAFPSAQVDVFAITDWLFPRGLNHHEMFAGVPIAQTVMAKVARQLAGLGKLPDTDPPTRLPAQQVRCEVAVIGAGAAGLAAAQTLEEAGAAYCVIEREALAGGRLVAAPIEFGSPALWPVPKTKLRLGAAAIGIFEDNGGRFLAISDGARLTKLYAEKILLANGGHPQLLPFENNDLPGVFAARAVSRMIRLHRLLPGERIAVVGEPNEAKALAALITEVGGTVVAVGEEPRSAHGLSTVTAVTVVSQGKETKIDCDAIAVCAALAPSFELARQGGAHVGWREKEQLFAVDNDADGRTSSPTLFVAGELKGPMGAAAAAETGRRAAKSLLGGGP
jgi:sarcosine oxidase, subunit alpha